MKYRNISTAGFFFLSQKQMIKKFALIASSLAFASAYSVSNWSESSAAYFVESFFQNDQCSGVSYNKKLFFNLLFRIPSFFILTSRVHTLIAQTIIAHLALPLNAIMILQVILFLQWFLGPLIMSTLWKHIFLILRAPLQCVLTLCWWTLARILVVVMITKSTMLRMGNFILAFINLPIVLETNIKLTQVSIYLSKFLNLKFSWTL